MNNYTVGEYEVEDNLALPNNASQQDPHELIHKNV